MHERKKLADILRQNSDRDTLQRAWGETKAASDFALVPAAEYVCRVLNGELFNAKQKGTPGYKLTFEVAEGEHEGRRVWHDLWLTPQALPMAKRDLAKLGMTSLHQLEQPLPTGILVKLKLALRKDDDGNQYNRVRAFEAIGIEKGDAFEPEEAATETAPESPREVAAIPEPANPLMHDREPVALFRGNGQTSGPYGGDRR